MLGLGGVGMELGSILDQYVHHSKDEPAISLGNNKVLKTITKTLAFKLYVCDLDR